MLFSIPFFAYLWMLLKLPLTVLQVAWGAVHSVRGLLSGRDVAHAVLFGVTLAKGLFVVLLWSLSAVAEVLNTSSLVLNDVASVFAMVAGGIGTLVALIHKYYSGPTPPPPVVKTAVEAAKV